MNRYFIAILALVLTSAPSWAHNTNVTHPVITLEGARLIESNDKDQSHYQELYRKTTLNSKDIQGVTEYDFFWGVWNTEDWTPEEKNRLYLDTKAAHRYPQINKAGLLTFSLLQ